MKQCKKELYETKGLEHRDVQLSLLIDMNQPLCVLEEMQTLFHSIHPGADLNPIKTLFKDIVALFSGEYQGFKACTTGYHNLKHTTDTALALARLIHGANAIDTLFTEKEVTLGLMAALMHDVGYIQKSTENSGTGARLASIHIQRGIEFMTRYLEEKEFAEADIQLVEKAIACTDLERPVHSIRFNGRNAELVGKMLAASDLLAQTADRNYLEKLSLLFVEFKEAGINNYETEIDLLKDSLVFNRKMNLRLENDLDGVNRFMKAHFKTRWDIDRDMYQESIDRSVRYLASILDQDSPNYSAALKRKQGV
jgi:hypothetical protein